VIGNSRASGVHGASITKISRGRSKRVSGCHYKRRAGSDQNPCKHWGLSRFVASWRKWVKMWEVAWPKPGRVASRFAHSPNFGLWTVFEHIGLRNKKRTVVSLDDFLRIFHLKIQSMGIILAFTRCLLRLAFADG
jgi:hypothetical protein